MSFFDTCMMPEIPTHSSSHVQESNYSGLCCDVGGSAQYCTGDFGCVRSHVGVDSDLSVILPGVLWIVYSAIFVLIGASLIKIYQHPHTHIQIRRPGIGAACLLDFGALDFSLKTEIMALEYITS